MDLDVSTFVLIAAAGTIAGAIASISGFGVGSILTPVLSLWFDAKLAVAAVAIPHAIGTGVRFAMLRARVDMQVLRTFGVASAIGGLAGALLGTTFASDWLLILLACLLLFVAVGEFFGFLRRLVFEGPAAWAAGALSGVLGGLVGNQGGIRSAALLGFKLEREVFVATATAIALFVDGARTPVYFFTHGRELRGMSVEIAIATAAVVVGTIVGGRVLRRIPEMIFRRLVAILLAVLGAALLWRVS